MAVYDFCFYLIEIESKIIWNLCLFTGYNASDSDSEESAGDS